MYTSQHLSMDHTLWEININGYLHKGSQWMSRDSAYPTTPTQRVHKNTLYDAKVTKHISMDHRLLSLWEINIQF